MELDISLEATVCAATRDPPSILWNPKGIWAIAPYAEKKESNCQTKKIKIW
jgi:hypothetical protein